MFCRFCGKKIVDNSLFCPYCGKSLALQSEDEVVTPPPVEVPEKSEPPKLDTVQPGSQRGRWIALILGISLLAAVTAVLFATKLLCFHKWQEATCTQPETCARCFDTRADALGHKMTRATCTEPITCMRCGVTYGDPLGHDVKDPTCTTASVCRRCTTVLAKALGHIWIDETVSTPKMCERCGSIRPMAQPATGTIFIDESQYHGSSLEIHALSDHNTYVKLKDEDGNDVISFYLRAKETAEVRVPRGNYYIYFAHGIDWYGPEYAFGDDTFYEMDPDPMDFYNYTWEYTLDAGENGNTSSETISKFKF